MKFPHRFGFYGILTDPLIGYEELAGVMVEKGVRFVQLRMKQTSREEVLEMARRLRKIVVGDSLLIINDDPKIAAEVGADGVHLGQDDMDFEKARQIVGSEAIIGLSTHNLQQVTDACALGPDYIGVGPVYSTPTKDIPDPVLGLHTMAEMIRVSSVPAVAIGGIDHPRAVDVVRAGAENLCAVRCIAQSNSPGLELDKMIEIITSG
jgi:thiamine-phosphate pyrophosphorylase